MNEILLSNEVIIYLLAETVLYLLLFIAFLVTLGLLKRWNFDAFTSEQFRMENRSYLVMTIILFVMLLKILLLPYFVSQDRYLVSQWLVAECQPSGSEGKELSLYETEILVLYRTLFVSDCGIHFGYTLFYPY